MCALLIVAFLGSIPERGTVVPVPATKFLNATASQRATARRCAREFGLRLRVLRQPKAAP